MCSPVGSLPCIIVPPSSEIKNMRQRTILISANKDTSERAGEGECVREWGGHD